ncbi:hypothetical protein [Sphingobacterium sp. BS-2]|uniref:hypothetical protein n=1 Tax=Sphingobacterium sp. BS-2 TaxID=3377129 RepID=UPI0038FC797E
MRLQGGERSRKFFAAGRQPGIWGMDDILKHCRSIERSFTESYISIMAICHDGDAPRTADGTPGPGPQALGRHVALTLPLEGDRADARKTARKMSARLTKLPNFVPCQRTCK